MAKNDGRKNDKLFTDFVSQDKDWRGVIDNELRCQEGWHKDWGFLADDGVSEKAYTKDEKISVLEEKLKMMSDVKIASVTKQTYKGGQIDFELKTYNKRNTNEIMPQSRRPKNISKAHAHLKKMNEDYETKPYDNFLGAK